MPKMKPKTAKAKKATVKETMHEFKRGKLHSGSDRGPKVKDRKQAVAIAMHQAGMDKKKSARNKRLADKPL